MTDLLFAEVVAPQAPQASWLLQPGWQSEAGQQLAIDYAQSHALALEPAKPSGCRCAERETRREAIALKASATQGRPQQQTGINAVFA